MSREPTRHQLSSKLAYEHKTPAFLQKLQRQYGGRRDGNDREDEYDDDEEFEDDGSGRPPIPRRPAIPERPENDHGSADEDGDDEKPQVVVLKQGKHLSEREAENEKRKAAGLPPLVDPPEPSSSDVRGEAKKSENGSKSQGLMFSSSGVPSSSKKKRKAGVGVLDHDGGASSSEALPSKKKAKKSDKKLLSFGDEP